MPFGFYFLLAGFSIIKKKKIDRKYKIMIICYRFIICALSSLQIKILDRWVAMFMKYIYDFLNNLEFYFMIFQFHKIKKMN